MWSELLAGPVTGVSVTAGMLFTESSDGTVTALRIGGEVVWLAKTGASLGGSSAIMDNSVFVGAEDDGLYCYTPFGEPVVQASQAVGRDDRAIPDRGAQKVRIIAAQGTILRLYCRRC